MTRARWHRLLALGGLALALGCRSHPNAPPCDTPLLPGEEIGKPTLSPIPAPDTQLPTSSGPGILPPPAFAKLPENKPLDVRLPDLSPDIPVIRPPHDVAPLPGNRASALPGPQPREVRTPETAPVVKPLLVDPPRPPAGPDGFAPAPKIGRPDPPTGAVGVRPPAKDVRPLPLRSGERFGHGPDYKWVAGILDKHQKGGYWTLRYAPSGDDDPWGGKVRLLDEDKLAGFNSGDVVYVEGDLLAPRSAADTANYPPYRVTDIRLVEKAK